MHAVVLDRFHDWSEPLEGRIHHLYADLKGLVTVGVGQLVDPMSTALALPLHHADRTPATRDEIAAEWLRVKAHTCGDCEKNVDAKRDCPTSCLSRQGWRGATRITSLRIRDEDIDHLVERKLLSNESELRRFLPAWDSFPADAQLALLSWAWAAGPRARYPKMMTHLRNGNFAGAAEEVDVNPKVGTIPERNRRNRVLLTNADLVERHGLDRDVLYWPRELAAEYSGDDPPTAA